MVSTGTRARASGCVDESISVVGVGQRLINCSAVSGATIAAVLNSTDAAYALNGSRTKFKRGDEFIANSQWVAWIDTRGAPGIVRGLWPIDAAGTFAGARDPSMGGAFKSLLAIHQGFHSIRAPRGYKGLHVEVWKTFPAGPLTDECHPYNCVYSYANSRISRPDVRSVGPSALLQYSTTLRRLDSGSSTFVGLNGVRTSLRWTVRYLVSPSSFRIETILTSRHDVNFSGDAGGLLLLANPACRQEPRRAYTGDPHFANCPFAGVHQLGLHTVDSKTITPSTGDSTYPTGKFASVALDGVAGKADLYPSGAEQPAPDEDRAIFQFDSVEPFTLRSVGIPQHRVTVRPGYHVTGPFGGNEFAHPLIGYHFNATPNALGYDAPRRLTGVSGFGSLDIVFQPPRGTNVNGSACPSGPVCSIAIGPNRGALHFAADLTR